MKIKLSQLRQIIREAIEETLEIKEADKDLNKDGENDFEDVMIARMKASGMDHEKAVEKGEKAAKTAAKKQ
jgi:flagellar hook-basal body complex protein FliE